MNTVILLAEKSYYFYSNMPKFIQKIIKGFYFFIRFIYRILKKIARIFIGKRKKNTFNNNIIPATNVINKLDKQEIPDYYVDTKPKKGKYKISWIIPRPLKGSGGHRNFYRVIRYLAEQGHDVTIYIDHKLSFSPDPCINGIQAYEFIKENFFDLKSNVIYGTDNIQKCDILFATHYESAYIVKDNEKIAKSLFYFIQDYESYFTPMGDEFIRAHQSYKLGLYPITSGPWPLDFLKKNFGIYNGYFFRFPINKEIYYYKGKPKEKNSIIFFAKPNMPRRCYKLGLEALKIVKELRHETKIYFYGENSTSYNNVSFDFINCGLVPTIEELGELYRNCEIGLAFSTTNPSLVPFEMLSCGVAVVDLDFNNNDISYGSRDNITLAEPFSEKIAEKIIYLLDNKDARAEVVKKGMEFCKIFPTEKEMCKGIETKIMNRLKTGSKE